MKSIFAVLPLVAQVLAEDQIPLEPITSGVQPLTLDAIPLLGFGTWNIKEPNTSQIVSFAIEQGYRHIDCAAAYNNEEEVGKGIADGLLKTGLSRDDLWITSKLWNDHHDPELVEKGIDTSLKKLGLTYLDLYHMHWSVSSNGPEGPHIAYKDTWAAMVRLREIGKARHIGVSNFSPAEMEDLLKHTTFQPQVHQMELHPYLQQTEWLEWHKNHSIHVTAYSPLGGTNPTYKESAPPDPLLKNHVVKKISKKRSCTPAQVALQWGMARGTSVIPKSIHGDYITENFHSPECILKGKDIKKLDALGKFHHRYNNPSKSWGLHLYEGLEDDDGKHHRATWWDEE